MHAQQTYTIKVKHSSILQLIGMDHQVVCYVVLLLLLQLHAQHLLSLSLSLLVVLRDRYHHLPYYLDAYHHLPITILTRTSFLPITLTAITMLDTGWLTSRFKDTRIHVLIPRNRYSTAFLTHSLHRQYSTTTLYLEWKARKWEGTTTISVVDRVSWFPYLMEVFTWVDWLKRPVVPECTFLMCL